MGVVVILNSGRTGLGVLGTRLIRFMFLFPFLAWHADWWTVGWINQSTHRGNVVPQWICHKITKSSRVTRRTGLGGRMGSWGEHAIWGFLCFRRYNSCFRRFSKLRWDECWYVINLNGTFAKMVKDPPQQYSKVQQWTESSKTYNIKQQNLLEQELMWIWCLEIIFIFVLIFR